MMPREPSLLMSSTEFNHTMFALDQVVQRIKGNDLDNNQQELLTVAIQKLQAMVTRAGL
jgi:hypothetical protein